ncbi:MAG: GIY-YIG nuclease family protein [Gluconacetobacter liquefaciens]|uniref:GIY-YIG nuclease family protein n=1 Tax=Gluconacetobacter liquefaciens TaxID=89584 RepID=A0A7W4JIW7_GLULI|nr:GIY-YIG nuclease family protein [Gluconacetobacter liquefaciens]MBB2185604.1 GIY-YIG nuclease family protein [Gluconacetobacter liquefaciens]
MNKAFSSCLSGSVDQLLAGGFVHIGVWQAGQSGLIAFLGIKPVPRRPGVYAYAVGHEVLYVGSAQRGLHRRFRHYENSKNLRTASRIREALLERLSHGTVVDVYVIVPEDHLTLNDILPVDPVAGLEEGLIRALKPKWNLRGSGAG